MPPIQRMGDANESGGEITSIPQASVYADGLLVAVDGAEGTSHPPCPTDGSHCAGAWTSANGSGSVFVEGLPVNRDGDADTCGHERVGGSGTVSAGG